MDKILRSVLLHKRSETLKTCMWEILGIIYPVCRRMGNKYVKALVPHDLKPEFPYSSGHRTLGILMIRTTKLVFHRTAKSQNSDTLIHIKLVVYALAAPRRCILVAHVVIAMDIENGRMTECRKERQILWR